MTWVAFSCKMIFEIHKHWATITSTRITQVLVLTQIFIGCLYAVERTWKLLIGELRCEGFSSHLRITLQTKSKYSHSFIVIWRKSKRSQAKFYYFKKRWQRGGVLPFAKLQKGQLASLRVLHKDLEIWKPNCCLQLFVQDTGRRNAGSEPGWT